LPAILHRQNFLFYPLNNSTGGPPEAGHDDFIFILIQPDPEPLSALLCLLSKQVQTKNPSDPFAVQGQERKSKVSR
jgi:hypothetical protein